MKKSKQVRHLSAQTLDGAIQELLRARGVGYKIEITENEFGLQYKVDDLVIQTIPHDGQEEKDALSTTHSNNWGYIGYRVMFKHADKTDIIECKINSPERKNQELFWCVDMLTETLYNVGKKPENQSKREFPESFVDTKDGYVLGVIMYLAYNLARFETHMDNDGFSVGNVKFDTDTIVHNGRVEIDSVRKIGDRPAVLLDNVKNGDAINVSDDHMNKQATNLYNDVTQVEYKKRNKQIKKQNKRTFWVLNAGVIVAIMIASTITSLRDLRYINNVKQENENLKQALAKALELYQNAEQNKHKVNDTVAYNALQK